MSQLSSYLVTRRKMWTKVIVFLALVAVVWLQPKVQKWLNERGSDGTVSVPAERRDSRPSSSSPASGDRPRVIIKDVDVPSVAEVERPEPTPPVANRKASLPGESSAASATNAKEKRPAPREKTGSSKNKSAADTRADSKQVPGQLREIRKNVFESAAGLRYVPGSADDHRLKHVMQHARDDSTKPVHGVFDGERDQILAVIDEAYLKAKKGGRDVRRENQNDRLVYTVNLGRRIGYTGGSEGERKGNPACRCVRIVLEDENIVISAYPTTSF